MNDTLPHSMEAECATLGSILCRSGFLHEIADLNGDDMFFPAHREVLAAARAVAAAGGIADPITVGDEVKRRGNLGMLPGGEGYLLKLMGDVNSLETFPHYVQLVRTKAALRRIAGIGMQLHGRALAEDDPAVLAADGARDLTAAAAGNSMAGPVALGDGLVAVLDEIGAKCGKPDAHAVMTGIGAFDRTIRGFGRGKLVVVAARPGVGKTAFARGVAAHASKDGVPCLVFSLEMGFQEMAERFLAAEALVPGHAISSGRVDSGQFRELHAAAARLSNRHIWVDDRVLRAEQISATARAWYTGLGEAADKNKKALIVVDYLGLIRSTGGEATREREVAQMSWQMKVLAKDLRIPVMLVSQLNRRSEGEGRKPQLSDLRESGAIEQDADMVVFPYRDMSPNQDGDGSGPAELIVCKHRGGPTGTVPCWWRAETMTYHDVEDRP